MTDITSTFPTRTLAAKNAKRMGLIAFQCRQYGKGDGSYWQIEVRKESPVLTYGLLFATGKDYVSHVEVPLVPTHAILVITCHPDEVDEEPDELIQYEPVTPSMLDPDSTRRKRTARERLEEEGRLPLPVATLTYIPGFDVPLVHPIHGTPF